METPTVGKQLRLFRESRNMKQGEFCEYTGIKQQTISGIETGRSEPSTAMLQLLFQKFPDLSPDWLLLGTGPMLRDGRDLTPASQLPPPVPSKLEPSKPGLPTPGEATPQQADFVGKLIERLEKELAQAQADKEYLQGLVTDLMGKSDDSPDAAGQQLFTSFLAPVKNVPISLAPAATRQARELEYAAANTCRHIFVANWGEGAAQELAKEVAA